MDRTVDNLIDVTWAAWAAERLREHFPRADPTTLEQTARELWTDGELRVCGPRQAAERWLREGDWYEAGHIDNRGMKCPHCQLEIHPSFGTTPFPAPLMSGFPPQTLGRDAKDGPGTHWTVVHMECPACSQAIIYLQTVSLLSPVKGSPSGFMTMPKGSLELVFPRRSSRATAPIEVPDEFRQDYNEACLVLVDSPKACAALGRRCLQGILRAQGYAQRDLSKAIEAALQSKTLPPRLAASLDAVRNIGNFAAHPMKDTNSGEVLPVEPEEAEWNLEVLEALFDFYYVQPAADQERIDALNAKLASAGKPPIK